jgi:hypothetical protein
MTTLLIGYDLNSPGQNYEALIDRIKSHGAWWHHLDSTWLVRTSMTAAGMRDDLEGYLDSGDELLVVNVTGDPWGTHGISKKGNEWLHNNL